MQKQIIKITVETTLNAPIGMVWYLWTTPDHIIQWNFPSTEWHTTKAEIDIKNGGKFFFRMEMKNGNTGFDYYGVYDNVIPNELIEYTVSDGRKSKIIFKTDGHSTNLTETFEPETETPLEEQRNFVQLILRNFKKYVENKIN